MSSEVGHIFAAPAIMSLARHTQAPQSVKDLLAASAVRLLDSAMIIEDAGLPFAPIEESRTRIPLPSPPVLHAIRDTVARIASDGFGPHALSFFGMLGSVMMSLAGNSAQSRQVMRWVESGKTGAFCMTDRGGPNASQWRSGTSGTGPIRLAIDKIWAMNAEAADFAIVVARRGNSMILVPVVIPPEVYAGATRKASGAPFLDGQLPLGNVRLDVDADADWFLSEGGPISPKMFLTLARPWLIQALCAHAGWLAAHHRVEIDAATAERIAFLRLAAQNQAAIVYFDRFSEDQAMAIKWVANEVWSDLVVRGAVRSKADQRDLLAFTKMEGSSYRCFFEIYERNKRSRHVER
jgi:hypothetical protein